MTEEQVEAAAEALFVEASKDRFGKWPQVTDQIKEAWRKSARAALEAVERVKIEEKA